MTRVNESNQWIESMNRIHDSNPRSTKRLILSTREYKRLPESAREYSRVLKVKTSRVYKHNCLHSLFFALMFTKLQRERSFLKGLLRPRGSCPGLPGHALCVFLCIPSLILHENPNRSETSVRGKYSGSEIGGRGAEKPRSHGTQEPRSLGA